MLDDGVKGAGFEEEDIKVGDIAIHLLEAIEQGEADFHAGEAPLRDGEAGEPDDGPLSPVAGT